MTNYALPPVPGAPDLPEPRSRPTTELPGERWTHPALDLLPADDWAHAYFHAYLSKEGLGTYSRSYRAAGVSKDVWKHRRNDDAVFRLIHEAADDELREAFEHELHLRVLDGSDKPVYQRGYLVGYVREVDNRLLQWYLERMMPEKYHLATKFEMSGDNAPGAFKFAMGEVGDAEVKALGSGDPEPDE